MGEIQRTTISVFVTSDEAIPREALVHLVQAHSEYRVIGHSDMGGVDFVSWGANPPVVLIHIGILSARVLAAIKLLKSRRIPNVVLLRQPSPWLVYACHQAGATGLVLLESTPTELFSVINTAATHKRSVDSRLAAALFHTSIGMDATKLSTRESQVLRFLSYGYSNVQVAGELKISIKSVETYRARLMEKLGLKDRIDIVRFALMTGILSRDDVGDLAS